MYYIIFITQFEKYNKYNVYTNLNNFFLSKSWFHLLQMLLSIMYKIHKQK